MKRTILVTGGNGQVGTEVRRLDWPADVEIHAPGRRDMDIADPSSVAACISASAPACVINLAAYTAVDDAEQHVGHAFLANAQGPAFLAEWTRRLGIPLIHVSTDYVFDGSAQGAYRESDPTGPLSAYGASKLAGELAVRAGNERSFILRTAWVLSAHGKNFVKTMLRLASSNAQLRVVADQRGCPTSAADIAKVLQTLALRSLGGAEMAWGTYHFVNAGDTTWHGLAEHVFSWQAAHGLPAPKVEAISTSDYPTPARRPANSRLDTSLLEATFGISPRPWRAAVDDILSELATAPKEVQQGMNA